MPRYIPPALNWVREQVELYEQSGGTQGNTLLDTGMPVILVIHKGHKTGAIRKIPLMRVEIDSDYILIGSMGGQPKNPVWVYNIRHYPDVQIRDKTTVFDKRVREINDVTEREKLWSIAVATYPPYAEYQGKTARKIPVFIAESPCVNSALEAQLARGAICPEKR